jgi:hypothetical protein
MEFGKHIIEIDPVFLMWRRAQDPAGSATDYV